VISSIVRESVRQSLLHAWVKVLATSIEITIILSWVGIRRGVGLNPSIVRLNFGIFVSILLMFAFAVSFVFVAIARYSEVIEMTQDIGILRVLGASAGYILGILYQETLLVTILGTIAGIIMTYGAKWFVAVAFPEYLTLATMYTWWPMAAAISAAGPLSGAALALPQSVRQGVIQAISAEE
jgi:predicted lysophospholipase L1 biosynthesis ABC-type transport system permease subunit